MTTIKTILATMRLPFLVLTPACILLGVAFAMLDTGTLDYTLVALILLGGISAHISVNMFNEYLDYGSGLDFKTQRTPFSGGSGALPANPKPEIARKVLIGANISLLLTVAIGLYFIQLRGWGLLPLGLMGVLIILAYTRYLTRSPLLCLIAPGLGFSMMTIGSYFVLTGHYSIPVMLIALVPFFLVNNLLLLNQYPDIPADKQIGRFHIPIAYGKPLSNKVIFVFYLLAYLVVIIAVALQIVPVQALAGLLTALIAIKAVNIIRSNFDQVENMLPAMGMNVMVNIFTPVLIGIGVFFAS